MTAPDTLPCRACNGAGKVRGRWEPGDIFDYSASCETCSGTGRVRLTPEGVHPDDATTAEILGHALVFFGVLALAGAAWWML